MLELSNCMHVDSTNMATGSSDTPELMAFKYFTGAITNSVRNDRNMVTKLFEKGLISNATYDKNKAHKVVSSVRDKIEFDAKNFDVFLDILKEDLYHSKLKSALKEKRKKFRRVATAKRKNQRKWCVSKWIVFPRIIFIIALGIALGLSYYPQQNTDTQTQDYQQSNDSKTTLREYYKNLEEIDVEQYLSKSMKLKQIPFIIPNVQLADQYPAEVIGVKQLLKSVKSGTRIAITGRPGVGKSTLARYIAKLWANGEIFQKFTTLYHICLGRTDQAITNVQQLIMEECHGLINLENLEHEKIKHSNGKSVVFLLDGFDEYIPNYAKKKDELVLKLIKKSSLPKSAVVVMSRPRSVDDYKHHFSRVYEVIGFRPSDIETSLNKLETPLQTSINTYFDNNPNVKKMCYLPLHMTMIIYLASLSENPLSEMDSETKIFKSFLYLTIANYQERHSLNAFELNDCSEHQSKPTESQDSLCSLFISICELAFNATLHNQKTFSSKEIRTLSVNTDFLQKLSLFNIKLEGSRFGSVDVFSFSHQTFRDFMSAYHLILLPIVDQQKMIKTYANESTFRDLVWKFYFGLQGEKSNGKMLFTLFKSYVKYGGYKQLPSQYYQIDLYPLAYAFETGMHHDEFVDLLDYSKIIGPGNNHSLQFDIKEPMEVRSFFNIEENVNTNVNYFFMKYTLEWTLIQCIKIQLRIQPNQPDPIICSNTFWVDVVIDGSSLMKEYCNRTYMATTNYSSAVILELEYFHPVRKAFEPQAFFSMFKSGISIESAISAGIKAKMFDYLLDSKQKSSYSGSIRKHIILKIISQSDKNSSENLTQEELNFIRLWNRFDKYQKTCSSQIYSLNTWDLKKFKIQQLLVDYDLENLHRALRSATKLEMLDLSFNFLYEPAALVDLFKSLPHLKVLDLSNSRIPLKLDSLANGLKYLKNVHKLNVSGNLFSAGKGFGDQLKSLKRLEILDLSYVIAMNITTGLRDLTNLRQLIMTHCWVHKNQTQQLAHSLSSLKNLKLLDISHNLITVGPPFKQLINVLNQIQIEEVNLSHNLIRLKVSDLGDYLGFWQQKQMKHINLSSNYLCGNDEGFRMFKKQFQRSKLLKIDLSNNSLYFYNKIKDTIVIPNSTGMPAKTIYMHNSPLTKDLALVKYAGCICKFIYSLHNGNNYHQKCVTLSKVPQKPNATVQAQLDTMYDKIAMNFSMDDLQSIQQINLLTLDKEHSRDQVLDFLGRDRNYWIKKPHIARSTSNQQNTTYS